MKKLILSLAVAGLFSAPVSLFAQEGPEGEQPAAKSPQEMLEELHKLMKKASEEMGELENELAKASLDSPKADVIAERIKKLTEAMKQGKLDELPEGLRKQIQDNPEEAAKATGKSKEEIKQIAESSEELTELLRQNPELLKKLAESESTMESVLEKQQSAEQKLAETLKKQQEAAEAARTKVDESLEMAHDIKAKSQGGQGQGQPKNDGKQKTQDPREQGEKQNGNNKKPTKGAEEGYQPGEGEMKPEDKVEEYERGKDAGFQAEKAGKDMGDGASSDDRRAPDKYKGFWEKFNRETRKKVDERKKEE
ncbi:MAG: hypothetical protein H6841_00930 [Planctomycetes bacterium]|nr:hypothetical protein [Planctomycetota bacterium]MCB9935933.1 hypothetical protein [Planctomycetota bacterium]